MKITPIDVPGQGREGSLSATFAEVEGVLGFKANCDDDTSKVTHSWGFVADGHKCGIWDYKGSRILSTYGPDSVFVQLFGNKYSNS